MPPSTFGGAGGEHPHDPPPPTVTHRHEAVAWEVAPLPTPPPSERDRLNRPGDPVAAGLALLDAHAAVVSVLVGRSPADFRPVPSWVTERAEQVRAAFAHAEGLPPSLVAELAPLVAPRLERVVDHLRRRLGRERELLPLTRLREMDPACVRRNARLPGKTLIEKAGPRQQVVGVRRVPRFDTMENRVLVSTARALRERADHALRRSHPAKDPRAHSLRRLLRACDALLARPELAGLASPRPGERPSNALRGDADYRAVWRAGQLLKREEERFHAEWTSSPDLWLELVLLATWASVEHAGEPIPTWVRVADGRDGGLRVETGEPRRWFTERAGEAIVTSVEADRQGASIRVRRAVSGPDGQRAAEWTIPARLWIGSEGRADGAVLGAPEAAPGREKARELVAGTLDGAQEFGDHGLTALTANGTGASSAAHTGLAVDGASTTGRTREARRFALTSASFLGVCALDAHVVVSDGDGVRAAGPTAAARLAVPGELPLEAFGRAATWLPCVAGPETLFGARAEEGGALLAEFRGRRDTAIVVPDTLDELGVRRLRSRLGRAWFVWSPVAVALAAAAEHPTVFHVPAIPRNVLVVAATDAALDVAVLEDTADEDATAPPGRPVRARRPGRLWVRSAPLSGDAAGRAGGRFEDDGVRGAWLREPSAAAGWALSGHGARRVEVPGASSVADRVVERAARWRGVAPELLITAGLAETEARVVAARIGLPAVHLDAAALARGARVFLERYHAGLATWKDRLPELGFDVVHRRQNVRVPLVRAGTLVAPGDAVDFSPEQTFVLRAGAPSVSLRIARDGRPGAYAVVLDGAAFPLKQPVEVRVALRYTYGLQAMEGAVEPVVRAPFVRVPFRIDVADGAEAETARAGPGAPSQTGGPPLPQRDHISETKTRPNPPPKCRLREPLAQGAEKALRSAVQSLVEATKAKVVKEAQAQAGRADAHLRPRIKEVAEAAKVQAGSGPGPGPLREYLEGEAAGLLDWLVGLKGTGRGKSPQLGRDTRHAVVQARAELAVRGTGEFGRWLHDEIAAERGATVPTAAALYALGRVVDGDQTAFMKLAAVEPTDLALRGAWAAALRVALDARPDLAVSTDAAALLSRVVAALEAFAVLPQVEVWKNEIRNLADLVPRLCHARPSQLAPGEAAVGEAIERLEAVRAALPESVRTHGGRASTTAEAEPLAVAVAYLHAVYDHLPELR